VKPKQETKTTPNAQTNVWIKHEEWIKLWKWRGNESVREKKCAQGLKQEILQGLGAPNHCSISLLQRLEVPNRCSISKSLIFKVKGVIIAVGWELPTAVVSLSTLKIFQTLKLAYNGLAPNCCSIITAKPNFKFLFLQFWHTRLDGNGWEFPTAVVSPPPNRILNFYFIVYTIVVS